jgi:hypothetical protein
MLTLFFGSKCQGEPPASLALFNIIVDVLPSFGLQEERFVFLIKLFLAFVFGTYTIGKMLFAL